jgi:hypothetical protein
VRHCAAKRLGRPLRLLTNVTLLAKIFQSLINMSSTAKLVGKNLDSPDEVRSFEKGKIETVTLGDSGVTIGRSTF